MHVNVRAIIERETPSGTEIVIQTRDKSHEGGQSLELPGGRVEEFESLIEAVLREVREETGLIMTHIAGQDTRLHVQTQTSDVECLQPFAVYQTIQGPVDSMGVYFRCKGEGSLLQVGDDTQNPHWVTVAQIAAWIEQDPAQFGWIDRVGLIFYLKYREMLS